MRVAEVLRQIDADLIALQEVVGMDEAAHEHNQVRAIAAELGFHFRIGENRRHRGAAYGNAVLSRLPIVADHNHDLTCRKYEPRGCLQVTVAYEKEQQKSFENAQPDSLEKAQPESRRCLQFYNVHLGTSFFERRFQAHRLLDVLRDPSHDSSPRIVLGDFNEWTRGLATRLLSDKFNSAEPEQRLGRARSYPGVLPLLHLDHIYYDSSLELTFVTLHRSRLALMASDHLPLVAEFRLRD